ncbi:hypothetical protein V501_00984 [Pseudogymnoascus sp. VKM F-4519 (FW-2642)]|nr:hypothetical protein V501_00984 [Pseudogymnoascus sp. VKM F-4519 (FW-2642)]
MTRVLTEDMGMIVGIIAEFDSKNLHPRLAALDKDTLSQVSKGDTISIAVPEGLFLRELGRLCDADPQGMLMFGTSANLKGQGQCKAARHVASRGRRSLTQGKPYCGAAALTEGHGVEIGLGA